MFRGRKIASMQNPESKRIVKLRDKRNRDRMREFLIEGYREVTCAIESRTPLKALFYSPRHFLGTNETALIDRARKRKVETVEVDEATFAKLSYRDRPDGLLAIGEQTHCTFSDLSAKIKGNSTPFFLVVESIEKPGNLGSILRSSDAAGVVDAILLCDPCTDRHNPNVIRASVGTAFFVPVVEGTREEAIAWLRAHRIGIVATKPHAAQTFTEIDLTGPVAIAIGSEQSGLSAKWLEEADLGIGIPMHGVANSLNVANAATLFLYEVLRQRGVPRSLAS